MYLVAPDGSDLHRLDLDATLSYQPVCWLSSDQLLLLGFAPDGSSWDLWLGQADGTGLRRLTADGTPKALSRQPCAADGSRVAYTIGQGAGTAYSVAVAGGDPVPVTSPGWTDGAPTLSPDGRYAAVARSRPPERGVSILRVELATGAVLPLSGASPDDADALWSPDGTRLVLSSRRYLPLGRFPLFEGELSLLAADGSSEQKLTELPAGLDIGNRGDFTASWSPDGTRLIFGELSMPDATTRVMNSDGTCRTRIAQSPEYQFAGAWQPLPGVPPASPLECVDLLVGGGVPSPRPLAIGEETSLRYYVRNLWQPPRDERRGRRLRARWVADRLDHDEPRALLVRVGDLCARDARSG